MHYICLRDIITLKVKRLNRLVSVRKIPNKCLKVTIKRNRNNRKKKFFLQLRVISVKTNIGQTINKHAQLSYTIIGVSFYLFYWSIQLCCHVKDAVCHCESSNLHPIKSIPPGGQ